jgi:hypothetical protein
MNAFAQFTCKRFKKVTKTSMVVCFGFTLAIAVVAFIPPNISADNRKAPLDLQAKLLLNALSYYKNLEKGDGSGFDIAIVYFPWSKESKEEAMTFLQILKNCKDKKLSGRNFNVLPFTYNGDYGLKEKLAGKNVEVLFIGGEEEQMIREITQLTRTDKILSCTSNAKFVTSGSVTMAVGLKENKPKIYLNLSSAKNEEANFSARFLRVVEIVDEETSNLGK